MSQPKNKPEKTEEEKKLDEEIVAIIHHFEVHLNPACKRQYGNKTQRQACVDLLRIHGLEIILHLVEKVIPKTNGMAYMPTITTPLQLFDKYVALESAYRKLKEKSDSKKPKIIT